MILSTELIARAIDPEAWTHFDATPDGGRDWATRPLMQPSLAAAVRVQALLQEAGEEIEHLRGVRARYRAVLNVVTDMQTSGRLPDEDRKAIAAIINGPLAAALGVAEQPEGRVPE